MINIIVSVSENWVIGKDNKLIWRLSDDLKRFKELTLNHTVIMGQRTFESLPKGALPNRKNIVLTFDPDFIAENVITAYSIEDALFKCEGDEVFIIGGGTIYKQFLDIADYIYLTLVHTKIDGDTYFPEIENSKWSLISGETHEKDEKNEYDYTFRIYKRKY